MMRHLIRLIWNKKRGFSLLLIQIFISFILLFLMFSMVFYKGRNYLEPIGFNYSRVWQMKLIPELDTVAINDRILSVRQLIRSYPQVENVSICDAPLYMGQDRSTWLQYGKGGGAVGFLSTDEHFSNTLKISMASGRWYEKSDDVGKYKPTVLNKKAAELLFGEDNAVGKLVQRYNYESKVIGVVENFKQNGELMGNIPLIFEIADTSSISNILLIRIKEGMESDFEEKIQDVHKYLHNWNIEYTRLTDTRVQYQRNTFIPIAIFIILCGFLIINVALGLFGVLNLSLIKRKGEIGLRRAVGSTGSQVVRQFLAEIWIMTSICLLIGLSVAVQFPLFNAFGVETGVYLAAIFFSILIIYLIVTLSAWYPSRKASKILPANTLQEN